MGRGRGRWGQGTEGPALRRPEARVQLGHRADWPQEPFQTFQELIDCFCVISEDVA